MPNSTRLSAHFTFNEAQCKGVGCCPKTFMPKQEMLELMERTRGKFYPDGMRIVSWFRCRKQQKKVNPTVTDSQHCKGDAIDVDPRMTLAQAWALGWTGVGINKSTGLASHLDMGPKRWWTYPDR